MKDRLLIICFNNLKIDARVMRQINFLKDNYRVTVLCYAAYPSPDYEVYRVEKTKLTLSRKIVTSFFLLLRIHSIAYKLLYDYEKDANILKAKNFHLIIANDVESLPIAVKIRGGKSRIFFDAHEYAPRQFEDRLYWRIFFRRFNMHLCRRYIPMVDGMSTINAGLAEAYEKEFAVKPVIITNATDYFDLKPIPRNAYPIRLVHHGIFTLSRQPEIMIDLMILLDNRFTLDLIYLLPESASKKTRDYFESFKLKAAATGKIKIHPALKGSEIVPNIHMNYDMGIILVPPVNFNYENGLPNKLFECIQARLGMAVGPLREIAKVVHDNRIGVVSKDFTAKGMAEVLNGLTPGDVTTFKVNANLAAAKLSAQYNKTILEDALKKIA